MAPPRRKRLRRAAKAPVEAPGMAANDFWGQERRDLSGPEAVPEGNNPVPDKPGESSPSAGTFEDDVGNEVQKMLERLGVDIKQALLTERKMFEMGTKASIKTTNETIEHVWKLQQEQRQNLHLKYSQQFLTLFREWNVDMQKAQKQQEKLASMQDLEKDHEHLLTDEQSEVREETTKLQNKIMMEVQQQELAIVQKSLQSLLF
ncbi:synaptonemal complex protein 3-like isoform X3 [Prionailurus viverrinus]|uniref:synaptonemal complex protein 3-like isoform X3 n=1 Tax=Prionailurus viverrinus TaxID=61388 RepID=UPI001FF33FF4|nr:synaptonemal complex protein 3-like isoform X3 [Prionailurus viverrinus]XP_047703489.1 synaptonemal complex protein 3-like isoform X3 [Prionailurus viverrinus]